MTETSPLTLAYLESRPASAAKVLEDLDAGDAAAFLGDVPARLAAPVVAEMVPWSAAGCLELLSPDTAAATLRNMPYQTGTSILRLIPKDRFDAILESLPQRLARDFRRSLGYPRGTVGAWMDHTVPTFSEGDSVADGIRYAKRRRGRIDSHIFVVGERGRFAGAVSVSDLLRHDPKTPLSQILDRDVRALSNRAMLAAVSNQPDWDSYPMLPVVGRRNNVLGALGRKTLRRGLVEDHRIRAAFPSGTVVMHLFVAYFHVCSEMLRLVSEPDQRGPQNPTEEKANG